MRPRPPDIPKPAPFGINRGLVDSLSSISRGIYCDVIAQFVFSTRGERDVPMLHVWDGSDWDHDRTPLTLADLEERPVEIPPDEELKEKARGRMVTIFCYDYAGQCKRPIKSGDWVYFENLHCAYGSVRNGVESRYSFLVMHDNARRRHIWRLEWPILPAFFYERQWTDAVARTSAARPLPPCLAVLQQPTSPAAAAVATPRLSALDQIVKVVLEKMLQRDILLPATPAALDDFAEAFVATMAAAAERRSAAAAAPVADPAAPAAASPEQPQQSPRAAAQAAVRVVQPAAALPPCSNDGPSTSAAPLKLTQSPQSPRKGLMQPAAAAAAAKSPVAARAGTTAAVAVVTTPAGQSTTRKRSSGIKQEEPDDHGEMSASPQKKRREVVVIDSDSEMEEEEGEGEEERGGWIRPKSVEPTVAAVAAAPAATADKKRAAPRTPAPTIMPIRRSSRLLKDVLPKK